MFDLPDPPSLGQRLRRARLLKSLREPEDVTAAEIAKALAVSSQSVSSWEHDEKRPTNDNLERLAAFLEVRRSWLAFGEPPMAEIQDAAHGTGAAPRIPLRPAVETTARDAAKAKPRGGRAG
jgi:transcriptional regulator with XRE-family HTH domain